MHVSYVIRSKSDEVGRYLWPRVTVRNDSKYRVIATFTGHGSATDPDLPEYPLEMLWGVDDSPITASPGQTKTVDLGEQYGETLAVFTGGKVTSFKVGVTVGEPAEFGETVPEQGCPLPVLNAG